MAVPTDPMMGLSRSLRIAVLVFLAGLFGTVRIAHSQPSSAGAHRSKSPSNVDWPVYGGQAAGDHYSSLSQINRKNVHKLQTGSRPSPSRKSTRPPSPKSEID
jgi:glucose dehydrogenase